jgi:alpha-tubulin suppressor-like RCC1 family protein
VVTSLRLPDLRPWLLGATIGLSACGARTALEVDSASLGGSSAPTAGAGGGDSGGGATLAGRSAVASAGSAGRPSQPIASKAISAGTDSTCGLKEDGSVWCWGANDKGQLGNGTSADSSVPLQVPGITGAVAIEAGGTWTSGSQSAGRSAFNCAVLRDGDVQCWGAVPGYEPGALPVSIASLHQAVAIAAGNWHACALSQRGSVQCWGHRYYISDPLGTNGSALVAVLGLRDVTAIRGHGSKFTCAAVTGGSVQCWGAPYNQPEGDWKPVAITGVRTTPSGLAAGYDQGACAVSPEGSVQCWHGVTDPAVTVPGVSNATAVTVGKNHACALLLDGTIQCWGEQGHGQLGSVPPASTVSGIHDAVAVSAGYQYTCALSKAGTAWCWGTNRTGQLGNGADLTAPPPHSSTPVQVLGF